MAKTKATPKKATKPDKKADQKRSMFEKTVKAAGKKDLGKIADMVAIYEAYAGERNALLMAAEERWGKMLEMQRKTLPAAFAAAGVSSFTDSGSGAVLELDQYLSGTWPTDEKKLAKALAWVKKIKQEELIKCEIVAKFSRKDVALARKEEARLKKLGKAVVAMKQGIHYQTLQALFRTRLQQGKAIPFDIFDGETGSFVRIDMPDRGDNGEK